MLTLEKLKEFGADVDEGLARCMNNEDFYLKMVQMGLADERFDSISDVIAAGRYEEAFDMAHAIKGVLGNLALTPVYEPVDTMTELLRKGEEDCDYMSYCNKMKEEIAKLRSIIAEP